MEYEESEEYFGPEIGWQHFYQFSYQNFQRDCLTKNTSECDATGKRLYAGGHVGIRFLRYLLALFGDQSVIELGCGTGIIGLSLFLNNPSLSPSRLLLTDGALPTLQLTEANRQRLLSSNSNPNIRTRAISIQQLLWGDESHLQEAIAVKNEGRRFDILIGCELMYYNTDLPLLLSTVHQLIDTDRGIFVHVHHFRKDRQEEELISLCSHYDWITFEIEKQHFIDLSERKEHPEWYQIRALITGKKEVVESLLNIHQIPYKLFSPEMKEEETAEEDDLNETIPKNHHPQETDQTNGLFDLFHSIH